MEAIKILNDLISIDSQTNNSNLEIISYIRNFYPDSEMFDYLVGKNYHSNLVAKIRGKTKKTPLIFVSHTDTVNVQEGWETNPFVPFEKDGRIFGLGSSDMKGSVACVIASSLSSNPSRDIYLVFVGSEEDNSQGARDLIKRISLPPSWVIVPEPTGRSAYTSQKGYLEASLGSRMFHRKFDPLDKTFQEEELTLISKGALIKYSNPPFYLPNKSDLIQTIKSIDPNLNVSEDLFAGWTEAGIFKKYGSTVILGAGDYEQCHKPNESIDIHDLDYFSWMFRSIINYKT